MMKQKIGEGMISFFSRRIRPVETDEGESVFFTSEVFLRFDFFQGIGTYLFFPFFLP